MRLYMYAPDKVAAHSYAPHVGGPMVWKRGGTIKISLLYGGFITFSDNGMRL